MAEIVISVASKMAEYLVAPVGRQCGYVISADRYVGQLREELEKLDDVRLGVQRSVHAAEKDMREIRCEVNRWKNDAETFANKARGMLDNDGRAKKTCFCGWLPNPKERYCLGRDARKTVQAIQALIPQGKFERVYYESALPGLVGGAPYVNSSACDGGDTIQELIARGQFENPPLGRVGDDGGDTIQELIARGQSEKVDFENPPTVLVGGASGVNSSAGDGGDFMTGSRASIFQDIMKALDDEKLKVIGVYGPGGVGKTTLLKEVEKKLREAGRPFRAIVKVRVSQIPDLNNIRDQIADALGLDLKDKQSPEGKRDALSERLKRDPNDTVLIIFDNLWVKLDLEAVGVPWGDVSSKCKLLLTSRFKNVVEREMGADQTFLLQGLTNGEAFKLFENKVGDKLKDNEELKSIADQVVKKLAGLPLLIKSVATTLKSSDESAWRNALIEIDDSNKQERETIVKLSYDHLKSEDAKNLFLLCGLIGGTIRVECLFVLAMGLGLFERFNKTMQDSRDRLNNMLNELRSACLLLDGGDDKDEVTIHDLYSEVVVSTPFRDQNSLMISSNYGSSSKEKLEKCWAICLDDFGRDRLAELMMCQFPSLKILILSMPKVWDWIEEHRHDVGDCSGLLDFTGMKELQVLYLRSMHITNLPPSIEILGNLRLLYLYNCTVKDVAIIGKLKALQILSFARSTIDRLPVEMGELTNLRLLNLSNCRELQRIEPAVLKRLIKLEELHMKGSFDRWMAKNEKPSELCNVGLDELRSMTKLNSLEISIRDPIILLEVDDSPFENLTRFWIEIGNVYGRKFKGLRTMKIKLEGHDSILSKIWVQKILQKTQYLLLDGLAKFENAQLCIRGFPQLKHLDIEDSPSVKYIASSSNSAFTILESLLLNNLINLEKICHGHIAAECFSKLKAVSVEKCNRLEYLWSLSQMQNLVQLEKIYVRNCNSVRAIARKDTLPADCRVELPYLRHLYLACLPNMTSFCRRAEMTSEGTPIQVRVVDEGGGDEGTKLVTTTSDLQNTYSDSFFDGKASLPNLENLTLALVGSFKRIWHDELSRSSFCKLATITVKNCSDLLHIFPSTIIGRLHNLKSVEVNNCPSLKSLFDCGSLDSNMEQTMVLLPELVSINVESCPSLESLFNCGSLDSNVEDLKLDSVGSFKRIWHNELSRSSFCKLATTTVENCSNLLHIFPSTIIGRLHKLATITIENCSNLLHIFPLTIIGTLHKLESVEVLNCPSLKSLFDFRSLDSNTERNTVLLPELVTINVESCPSLESLFNCGSLDSNVEHKIILLPKLEKVRVSKAKKLRHVVMSHSQMVLIPSLRAVSVKKCSNLRYLFSKYTATSLMELKRLEITKCKRMKEVILEKEAGRSEAEVMNFPCLSKLILEKLDNLISFGSRSCSYYFSSLEYLRIVGCCNFGAFIPRPTSVKRQLGKTTEENDESPQPLFNEMVTFPNIRNLEIEGVLCKELWSNHVPTDSIICSHRFLLKHVRVKNCPSLESLFDFGSLNSNMEQNAVLLPELVRINAENCPSLESLFNYGSLDSNVEHKIILLPKLKEVRVSGAKKLRHMVMSHSQMVLNFPSLRAISIENCSDLQYLFSKYTATSLMKLQRLEITECKQMKEVILEKEAGRSEAEVMSFPCLSELTLEKLDNLISFGSGSCSYYFSSLENLRIVGCCNFGAFIRSPTSVKRQLGETVEENDESSQPLFNEMVTFSNLRNLEIEGIPCKELWSNHVPTNSNICSHRFLSKHVKVKNCLSLESLFDFRSLDSNTEQNAVLLPELVRINVENCPSLKSLFTCGSLDSNAEHKIILLPKLEEVRVRGAKKLRHVVMSHSLMVLNFPSLKAVSVENCSQLQYLFSKYTATSLMKLERLEIIECKRMKEVILEKEASRSKAEVMSFPYLSELSLEKLDNLISFGSGSCSYYFSSLENLRIVGCCNFGAFIRSPTSVKRQLGETVEENDESSQPLFNEMVTFSNLRNLEIEDVPCKELWSNHVPTDSNICSHRFLSKHVKVKNCPSLESLFDFRSLDSNTEQNAVLLPELVRINVENCPSLKSLFTCGSLDSNAEHKIILLPKLEEVRVSGAKKLRHVVMSHSLMVLNFPSLKAVSVENCSQLQYLFSKYTATSLMKLERLEIIECKRMKEVILEKEASRSKAEVMSFPYLSELSLEKLDSLISFGSGSCSYYFSSLENLRIVGCCNFGAFIRSPTSVKRQLGETIKENDESSQPLFNEMVTFSNLRNLEIEGVPCKELWSNHVPTDSNICSHRFLSKHVKVKNCPSLESLFDFGSLDSITEQNAVLLPELVRINVESCHSLESLFNCGSLDSNVEHKIILLPKLEEMRVSGAKKLRHVVMSHSQMVLNFPSLRAISIENCSDLQYLFSKYTATSLMELKRLEITKCKQMKEVIVEKEAGRSEAEVMNFPCLSELKLEKLNNLISFGSGSCSYYFSSLENLTIVGCCNFGAFIRSPTSVKRQLGETVEENDESSQPLFNEMVTFSKLRNLKIKGIPCKELWSNHVPTNSIICSHRFLLKHVKVKNCPSLESLFDFGSLDSNTEQNVILLPELVRINVENCPSLKSLFTCGSLDSNAEHKIILLPKLEEVRVSGAKKLRHVVMSHSLIVLNFPSLKAVSVENCSQLRYLFSRYMATSLMKLERLEIIECKRMKEVILEKEASRSEAEVMSFPCLSELSLEMLDNLISFGSGSYSYYFPSLEDLRILGCRNFGAFILSPTSVKRQLGETAEENDESPQPLFNEMVTFPIIRRLEIGGLRCKEIWNNQIPIESFQKLKYLALIKCNNLQRIATSYMWKKLQRCLRELKVISCCSIEVIYYSDETDTESGELRGLFLHDLKNLRRIWQSDGLSNVPFPNLKYVHILRCSRLEMLFPTFTAKFLGQIEELMVESCKDMKLIAGHEKGEEATRTTVTFSKLTLLLLFELPKFRSLLPKKYSLKLGCSEDFPSLRILKIESCGAEQPRFKRDMATNQSRLLAENQKSLNSSSRWFCSLSL